MGGQGWGQQQNCWVVTAQNQGLGQNCDPLPTQSHAVIVMQSWPWSCPQCLRTVSIETLLARSIWCPQQWVQSGLADVPRQEARAGSGSDTGSGSQKEPPPLGLPGSGVQLLHCVAPAPLCAWKWQDQPHVPQPELPPVPRLKGDKGPATGQIVSLGRLDSTLFCLSLFQTLAYLLNFCASDPCTFFLLSSSCWLTSVHFSAKAYTCIQSKIISCSVTYLRQEQCRTHCGLAFIEKLQSEVIYCTLKLRTPLFKQDHKLM